MLDSENIRLAFVKGLKKHLNCPIIRNNQNAEMPTYPFGTYHITTYSTQNNGTYGEYSDGKARKPVTQVISFTFHSDDYTQAITLANQARDWLSYVGTVWLNDNDVIVQSVGAISDRSNVITVDYQYSYGFDCSFWTFDTIDIPDGEVIEYVELGEDWSKRMENRLSGVDGFALGGNQDEDEELNKLLENRLSGVE